MHDSTIFRVVLYAVVMVVQMEDFMLALEVFSVDSVHEAFPENPELSSSPFTCL